MLSYKHYLHHIVNTQNVSGDVMIFVCEDPCLFVLEASPMHSSPRARGWIGGGGMSHVNYKNW